MNHIQSLHLKLLPVIGPVPLCLSCGHSSNGVLLVDPRLTKRERLRSRKNASSGSASTERAARRGHSLPCLLESPHPAFQRWAHACLLNT